MTHEQAEQLMRMYKAGYTMQVDTVYVDSTVEKIYKEGEDILFDCAVYRGANLMTFSTAQVKVSKPPDEWWNQPI